MMFNFNEIDKEHIQIYGSINGSASIKTVDGMKCWGFLVKFFKGSSLITVSTHFRDGTIWNKELLKERILKAYNEKI